MGGEAGRDVNDDGGEEGEEEKHAKKEKEDHGPAVSPLLLPLRIEGGEKENKHQGQDHRLDVRGRGIIGNLFSLRRRNTQMKAKTYWFLSFFAPSCFSACVTRRRRKSGKRK